MEQEEEDPFSDDYIPPPLSKGFAVAQWEHDTAEPSTINVIYDDETMATVDEETGEVYGLVNAPASTGDIKEIAEWLGEKLTWIDARIAGINAERQSWLDKVSKMYDPRLNHFKRLREYLLQLYTPIFDTYAQTCVFNGDGSLRTKSKTVKIGLLKMAFRTTVPRTDVLKEKDAVELIRQEMVLHKERGDTEVVQQLRESIKVTRTLLKSALPMDVMISLDPEEFEEFLTPDELLAAHSPQVSLKAYLEKKGIISCYEGGEEKFTLG